MHCPFCNYEETKVFYTRLSDGGLTIRRRRRCSKCGERFTTYEEYRPRLPLVIKKDLRREQFRRDKKIRGIQIACQKRPISYEKIEQIAIQIEREFSRQNLKEIESREIGEQVMKYLRKLDSIAYLRFASVYREFEDLEQFIREVNELQKKERREDG